MGMEESDKNGERESGDARLDASSSDSAGGRRDVQESLDKLVVQVGQDSVGGSASVQMGTSRYVFAAFFAVGIGLAYVFGQAITTAWTKLASTQSVVDYVPWLQQVGEDARDTWGHVAGGILALVVLVYTYRRKDIRTWVNDAAMELGKVTWPTKDEVIHGTVVVVVAAFISTVYLTLLDRFWGFVTDLVYRA